MSTIKLLRIPQVCEITGYKRSSIYKLMKEGSSPSPINLGKNTGQGGAVAWLSTEIDEWVKQRIEESRNPNKEGQA